MSPHLRALALAALAGCAVTSTTRDTAAPNPPGSVTPPDARTKRQTLEAALRDGATMIYLDARIAGVVVPPQLSADYALGLRLSLRFPNANMVINDEGVQATLSFSHVPFRCQIPWRAIWRITPPGTAHDFSTDLPPEIRHGAVDVRPDGGPETAPNAP